MDQATDQVKTQNKKFNCLECKNDVVLDDGTQLNQYVECSHCGIEYEVVSQDQQDYTLQLIEEEK